MFWGNPTVLFLYHHDKALFFPCKLIQEISPPLSFPHFFCIQHTHTNKTMQFTHTQKQQRKIKNMVPVFVPEGTNQWLTPVSLQGGKHRSHYL